MEMRDGVIRIDKPPSSLDELVLDAVTVFEELGIRYSIVSGYVAVLLGRSRATEDVDVIVEPLDEETADELADRLVDAGYWGTAMPLDDLYETLADDLVVRIAEDDHRVPNVELKFASDRYDRESLENTVTVRLNDASIRIGSLELQIAYKLRMGANRDFEDALYLYHLVGSSLNTDELEGYVRELGVEDEYDRLRSA